MNIDIENESEVLSIVPLEHAFEITIKHNEVKRSVYARKIVLATGREGMARPRIPSALQKFLGNSCQHSSEQIDFRLMEGKDIGVVGVSASAIDNAASALEAGANKVFLFVRSPTIPRINKMKSTGYPGFTHGFPLLPVTEKLDLLSYVFQYRVAPPRLSLIHI